MGKRGPIPIPEYELQRRNEDARFTRVADQDSISIWFPAAFDYKHWSGVAKQYYQTIRRSPQARTFTPISWMQVHRICRLITADEQGNATKILAIEKGLLVAPADSMRARISGLDETTKPKRDIPDYRAMFGRPPQPKEAAADSERAVQEADSYLDDLYRSQGSDRSALSDEERLQRLRDGIYD